MSLTMSDLKILQTAASKATIKIGEDQFLKQNDFINDPAELKAALCTRRCLAEGTLVSTTKGIFPIEKIKVGDYVYDENCNPVLVKETFSNGVQEVFRYANGGFYFYCTKNHMFSSIHPYAGFKSVRAIGEFYHGLKIERKELCIDYGKDEKHAYALGVIAGDGCCRQGIMSIHISADSEEIPKKIKKVLGAKFVYKQSSNNYTWVISNYEKGKCSGKSANRTKLICNHYEEWFNNKYAHEKKVDKDIVMSWSRKSKLEFIAGILDSDGSVHFTGKEIFIRIGMQAKQIIDVLYDLFIELWQVQLNRNIDNRKKYKNGPIYNIGIKHIYHCKRILKELNPHIVKESKKYIKEYDKLIPNNFNPNYIGVKKGKSCLKNTYDMHVDSDTNLYILANGLVTHNSGKSFGAGRYLLKVANDYPNVKCLYIALTRDSAKSIMWNDVLKVLLSKYSITAKTNEIELSITLANGSSIKLVGADAKPAEMEKFLGQKYKLVIIDEAGSFRQDLNRLVYEIIGPACVDLDGTTVMIGTPTDLIKSLFYDVTTGKESGWSVHKWSTFDNPYIKEKWQKRIDQQIENDPKIVETPAFKRMYMGEWFIDTDKLVYKFNRMVNVYKDLPKTNHKTNWYYLIGVDLGYEDHNAFVVACYNEYSRHLWYVYAYKKNHLDFYQVSVIIKALMEKYNTSVVIIDNANKQGVEEMKNRYNLPLIAADKLGKVDNIELMNADFIMGNILVHESCTGLMDEYDGLIWDDKKLKKEEHASCPNHLCDAALYVHKYAYNYCFKNQPVIVPLNSEKMVDDFWERESRLIEMGKIDEFGF